MKRVVVLVLVVLAGTTAIAWRLRRPQRLIVSARTLTLPADGATHRALQVHRSRGGTIDASLIASAGLPAHAINLSGTTAAVDIQAPVRPAIEHLTLRYKGASTSILIHFTPDANDRFADGTPDFLRLHSPSDRAAFRAWFTTLADIAATLPPAKLPVEINDCAALLRWSYRGALHAHDEAWLSTMPLETLPPLPSILQYTYPLTPLGAGLFRVRPGPYVASDATDEAFAQFADAKTLWQFNTFFLTRDVRAARPGDLLFYRQLEQNSSYHSMILTGPQHNWAVYHTGPIGSEPTQLPGEVRRVALYDLLHHPDARWRPLPENSNFLGVYRWNILREDLR